MQTNSVTGLILAGGKSRRFGRDKARYPVAGRPMMVHVIEAVSSVTDFLLFSVREDATEWLHHAFPDVQIVRDRYKNAGPLAGLHAGLTAAATPWVLAVACDMPFVTPDVLRRLLDVGKEDAQAVVARTPDGRLQPLCACYHTSTLALADAQLAAGVFAIHALLDRLECVQYVDLPEAPLRNVNRVADLPDPKKRS